MYSAPYSHETSVRVRYADTDQMGVVYYGVYMTWFEIGRTEMLRATGTSYREVEQDGYRLPVTSVTIDFLKPARYDDVIHIVTRVDSAAGARIRFVYEVRRGGELLATGSSDHVFTDADLKPTRPPRVLQRLLYGGNVEEHT